MNQLGEKTTNAGYKRQALVAILALVVITVGAVLVMMFCQEPNNKV